MYWMVSFFVILDLERAFSFYNILYYYTLLYSVFWSRFMWQELGSLFADCWPLGILTSAGKVLLSANGSTIQQIFLFVSHLIPIWFHAHFVKWFSSCFGDTVRHSSHVPRIFRSQTQTKKKNRESEWKWERVIVCISNHSSVIFLKNDNKMKTLHKYKLIVQSVPYANKI